MMLCKIEVRFCVSQRICTAKPSCGFGANSEVSLKSDKVIDTKIASLNPPHHQIIWPDNPLKPDSF